MTRIPYTEIFCGNSITSLLVSRQVCLYSKTFFLVHKKHEEQVCDIITHTHARVHTQNKIIKS